MSRLACAALCLSVSLGSLGSLGTKVARSAPLSAVISVEREDSARDCPDAAALTGDVERILQRKFAPSADALRVAVRFTAEHEDYAAEVRSLGSKPGERQLRDRGRSCAALAEAVSVTIALLLDKELEQRSADSTAAAVPAASEPVRAPLPAEAAPQSLVPAPVQLRALFEAGLMTGLSGSGAPLLGEQLGLRVHERLLLEVGFNAALPTTTSYGAGRVRTSLLFASLRACYAWGVAARYSLGPCALLGAGRLRGVGLDYASVESDSLPWVALGAGLLAEGPVWGRVFWGLSGTLWLPTRRSTFSVENVGSAWESSPIGAAATARLGFRIW